MISAIKWLFGLVGVAAAALGVSWILTMPDKEIRGTWETEGYGLHLDIGRALIDIYQVTEISCHRAYRLPAHQWLIAALEDVRFTSQDEGLQIVAGGTLNPIRADRTASLPDHCPAAPVSPGTAQENFDVLWQAMHEHYAFFDLHEVDWAARRAAYRPEAAAVLDEDTLFDLFKQTLDGLDDGHLYIARPDGEVHSPSVPPDWHDDRHMVRDNTLAQFTELTAINGTGLLYGWATPDIGYVCIAHMDVDEGFNIAAEDAAQAAFAEIATVFADAQGIILDVRYNPGGSDDIALAYASYFTDQTIPAFTKSTRTDGGYTPPYAVALEPHGTIHLVQPTIVLTTGFTGSAAEIFTMAMRELPQVTVMGTSTSGGLSDGLDFTLPNGWILGLSHQRYLTPDGTLYEGVGVPPDINVQTDVESARNGIDAVLDASIRQISS